MIKFLFWLGLGILFFTLGYEGRAPAATPPSLQESIQKQQAVVNELSQKLTQSEQVQAYDSLSDLRQQIADEQQTLQNLNGQILALNQQTYNSYEPQSDIDQEATLAVLQEQVRNEEGVVQSLAQNIRNYEQTNIDSVNLDDLRSEYRQESANLAQLQESYQGLRANSKLEARLAQNSSRAQTEDRSVEEQRLQQQYQQEQQNYAALVQNYDQAQNQLQKRQIETDDLSSRYAAEKRNLDQLEAVANARNQGE